MRRPVQVGGTIGGWGTIGWYNMQHGAEVGDVKHTGVWTDLDDQFVCPMSC